MLTPTLYEDSTYPPMSLATSSSPNIQSDYRQLSYRQFYNWTCWVMAALLISSCISVFWCCVFWKASKLFNSELGVLTQSSYAPIIQWEQGYCVKKERMVELAQVNYVVLRPSGNKLQDITTREHIDRELLRFNDTTVCYILHIESISFQRRDLTKQQIRTYYLLSDGIYCFLLLLSLFLLHLSAGRLEPPSSSFTIDLYSVQIKNLPILPRHLLLPSLKEFLQYQVSQKYLLEPQFTVFDIQASFDELTTRYHILLKNAQKLQEELQFMERFNYPERSKQKALVDAVRLELLEVERRRIGEVSSTACVWVTCRSVEERWKLLQTFNVNTVWKGFRRIVEKCTKSAEKKFMRKTILIEKTAQPEQINWQNLYVSKIRRFIVRVAFYSICVILLLGFNITILVIQNSIVPTYISPILILILNFTLTSLLTYMSSFQKYKLKSREHSSSMIKLTICQYINLGVIILINSYELPNWLSFLTTKKYSTVYSAEWIRDVGVTFVLTLAYQIGTNSLGVFAPGILRWLKVKVRKIRGQDQQEGVRVAGQVEEAKLYQSYSSLLAPLFVAMTYNHLLPLTFPILFILFLATLLSLRYLHIHLNRPPASSDGHLHTTASKLIFLSICLHFLAVSVTFSTRIHLWICISLCLVYLCREILVKYFIALMRKLKGPICQGVVDFVSHQESYPEIVEVFSERQRMEKIEEVRRRKLIALEAVREAYERQRIQDVGGFQNQVIFLENLQRMVRSMQASTRNCLRGRTSYSFLGEDTLSKT